MWQSATGPKHAHLPIPAADDDMLIGRAQGNGGVFVFTRASDAEGGDEGSQ